MVPSRPRGRIPETRGPDPRMCSCGTRGSDGILLPWSPRPMHRCWSAGNASLRCSNGCSPPREPAMGRCSSCRETLGSARPRCSSMRLRRAPIFACSEPRGSKGRRSSTTRRCSSCARRSWSCPRISRARNARRSTSLSAAAPATSPAPSWSALPCSACCRMRQRSRRCSAWSTTPSGSTAPPLGLWRSSRDDCSRSGSCSHSRLGTRRVDSRGSRSSRSTRSAAAMRAPCSSPCWRHALTSRCWSGWLPRREGIPSPSSSFHRG